MNQNLVRKLHVRQHFHSVGHGLFYSFDIMDHDSKEENLLFVYDCGTKSQCHFMNTELRSFDKRHGEKKAIHVLTLSCFDADHFHGLQNLLEDREKGEMVFLPKLTFAEKLFHRLSNISCRTDDEYWDFLENPHYFLEQHFKKVYFIQKALIPALFAPNQVELGHELIELIATEHEEKVIDDNAYLKTNLGWLFYFFLSSPEKSKMIQVDAALKKLNVENKNLNEIANDPILSEQVKLIFQKANWTLHETSLACVHGPVSVKQCFPTGFWYSRRCLHFLDHLLHRPRWLSLGGKDFCVLTGSMNLSKYWDDLKNKLHKIGPRISIFVIPQQGAHQHWNEKIVEDIDPDAWVLSSRIFSLLRFDHHVLSDLKHRSRGGEICKVHEFKNMAIERIFILNILNPRKTE